MSFLGVGPSNDAQWRAIVLFGRNSASFKFALAQALLDFARRGETFVSLEDLAVPYARRLSEHARDAEKQGSARSSAFLDAVRAHARGELDDAELRLRTVKLGFANVLGAFHRVNGADTPVRFFEDGRRGRGGLVLTDALLALPGRPEAASLGEEAEARWRLVETAWALSLSPHLLAVRHDPEAEALYVLDERRRRRSVTSVRAALSGYQKGRCFHCFSPLPVAEGWAGTDVDHFLPRALARYPEFERLNLDGVWNLVLACEACNRGPGGKFALVPEARLLERLHRRNEFLVASHHPLRETLILQTGSDPAARVAFLARADRLAVERLVHRWSPPNELEPAF